jgi:hypothetical protein
MTRPTLVDDTPPLERHGPDGSVDLLRMYRTPTWQGLALSFSIQCTDPELVRYLEYLLAPLASSVPETLTYSLVTGDGGEVDIYRNETHVLRLARAADAVAWLLADVNRVVVEASSTRLLFHGGGVQSGDVGVLLPAPSGSGKSTLVAALVRSGLHYLSDEVMALTCPGAQLLPYPKPLTIKRGSFSVLADLQPQTAPEWAPFVGEEWSVVADRIAPGAIGTPCQLGLVVVPRYTPDARTRLRLMPAAESFLALAVNSLNMDALGSQGAELLGSLVEGCPCYELELSDVDVACRLVLGLL